MKTRSPRRQLDEFLKKYDPEIQKRAAQALQIMRARFPGATQLVYDNYNALAIGFGPTERASDAIFSIAAYPRWVSLFFLEGASLPDPEKILQGTGNVVRHVVLTSPEVLNSPAVRTLMKVAVKQSGHTLQDRTRGKLIIKSISAKQRPRRPARAK
ncbi:MAG: DUF1801 domain-containing protein [Acidobacteriia bacterium]|nr:DUF1801 domain-containing protein [Terriglobia bacterium]